MLIEAFAPCEAHGTATLRVVEEEGDCLRERLRVPGWDEHSGYAVDDHLYRASVGCRDHWDGGSHRLKNDNAERLR